MSTVLTSTRAGHTEVTATWIAHEVNATERFAFVADQGTDFTVATGAIADGSATNAVSATVKDAVGNLVGEGVVVTFTVTSGAARFVDMDGEQFIVVTTNDKGAACVCSVRPSWLQSLRIRSSDRVAGPKVIFTGPRKRLPNRITVLSIWRLGVSLPMVAARPILGDDHSGRVRKSTILIGVI